MKKLCFISILLNVALLSWAVAVIHIPPTDTSPGSDLELLLEITQGGQEVANIDISYRLSSEEKWSNEPMHQDAPDSPYWRGIIPKDAIGHDKVEYRFEMKLHSGATAYVPERDSMQPNYILNPLTPGGTLSKDFVLLSDESSISADEGYVLAVSFLGLIADLDIRSIKVIVDGRDVTKQAQISNSVLVYRQDLPREGIMKAVVKANVKGKQIYSDTWITQILPGTFKRGLPFTYRGSVNFSTNIYDVSGDNSDIKAAENDFRTWADLYGNYGVLDMQANLLVSSLEDSNMQPVNRYTFGLQLPSLDLYLGDYSPNLSKYSLSGKNLRGFHARLFGRYLELAVSHGESVRKTQFQNEAEKGGTFKQEAFGAKLRLGDEDGFRIAFTGSRHRDVVSSLAQEYYRYEDAQGDTVYTVMAKDNAVLSVDARLNVPDQHVIMGIEMAGSLYNSNTIPGVISDAELEEYGLDTQIGSFDLDPSDFSDLFVMNKNMEPFQPSKANLAWTAYLRMYVLNNFLNFEYSETGSAFYALGVYAQPVDSKVFTITDHMNFGRLLSISGSYTSTQDNLMKHRSESNTYCNINAQAILRVPKMPYLKASYYSNTGENKLNSAIADSSYTFAPFNRDSNGMSFGLGYDFVQIPYVPTLFDISYRLGSDFSEIDAETGLSPLSDNENSGISFSMNNRFTNIPLRTQLSYVNSQNSDILQDMDYANSSIFLKADYSFLSGKIKPYVSFRTTSLSKDYEAQNYKNYNLGVESYPMKDMTVSADLGLRSYINDDTRDQDYSSTSFRLCLTQRF
ncbi:MAG: hypothetical protein RBR69_01900 [Candidatus Cloacimonadaceae bacterium]|jgi:hypothetical protein|nr:hypothetical protein [Candidatus Cloacimonadota bacterium]MDY0126878.1 hypothetical protein [Candidatus Cloacimonadaceae bacterium]MCB5254674.1 hypothetical protein [Candidatus Cloacimonadota bacterium]MCK9178640.1 hypothetical protein [Candidatus Cloacimonadota bacterium]MCK9241790.1 hypothetical protein [Candidatus Cloacimonadota bacterium]